MPMAPARKRDDVMCEPGFSAYDLVVTIEIHGDSGLLVRVGCGITDEALDVVVQLKRDIDGLEFAGIRDVIAAYTSVLVVFDPAVTDAGGLADRIKGLAAAAPTSDAPRRRWRIPVAYGGRFGIDLAAACDRCGMSPERFVEMHAGQSYTVAMIGFLPGFAYLAGLPAEIAMPRRATPRLKVPAGIIAIGGAQTAVGSVEGPSGWHIIGRTPVVTFDPGRTPATFLAPGDAIEFEPIGEDRFEALSRAVVADGRRGERSA